MFASRMYLKECALSSFIPEKRKNKNLIGREF